MSPANGPTLTPAAETLWVAVREFLKAVVDDAELDMLARMQRARSLAVTVRWMPERTIVVSGVDDDGAFEKVYELRGRATDLN